MNYRKYQEYFVKYCFLINNIIQNIDIFKKFKDQFKMDISLNNLEIYK